MRKKIKRLLGFFALGLLGLLATAYWWVVFYPNLHTVVERELYRSGQLSSSQLEATISEKQIATVINLRGAKPSDDWWLAETAVCKKAGVTHHDFTWTNRSPPSREDLYEFLETCRNTPKPLPVHCRSGADRTALACALYLHHIKRLEETEARKCYSLQYGHVAWASSRVRKWNELFFARVD